MTTISRSQNRIKRHRRVRAKIAGTELRPRITVFRSNQHLSAQLINDDAGTVLAAVSDRDVKNVKAKPVEKAKEIGILLARKATEISISKAVFDRGGYKYHGNVKALAEGAREGGLEF